MRKRPILKRTGAGACVVLVIAMAATPKWYCCYRVGRFAGCLNYGAAHLFYYPDDLSQGHRAGWRSGIREGPPHFRLWPETYGDEIEGYRFSFPLWMILAMIGIPTLLAFRRDRRRIG